eukprot:g2059.t1
MQALFSVGKDLLQTGFEAASSSAKAAHQAFKENKSITETIGAAAAAGGASVLTSPAAKGAYKTMDKMAGGQITKVARAFAVEVMKKGVVVATEKIQAHMHDPYAPSAVQQAIRNQIDRRIRKDGTAFLQREIEQLGKTRERDPRLFAPHYGCCRPNPCTWLRATVLYHLYPYDRTNFGKICDPVWWVLMVFACFPFFGVNQAFWVLVFVLKDKSDEYQLVNFITSFKCAQAVGWGLFAMSIGAVRSAVCTTKQAQLGVNSTAAAELECARSGPGSSESLMLELLLTAVQVVLAWVAYALIPCSVQKGWPLFEGDDGNGEQKKKGTGGRVHIGLVYDLVIFAGCVCGGVLIHLGGDDEWVKRSHYYWLRTLYGLLAIPWLLFKLPMMSALILHTQPTGYNRQGTLVRQVNGEERNQIYSEMKQAGQLACWPSCRSTAKVAPARVNVRTKRFDVDGLWSSAWGKSNGKNGDNDFDV